MISEASSEVGVRSSVSAASSAVRVDSYSSMLRSERVRYSPIGTRNCSTWSSWRMIQGTYSALCSLDSVGK